MVNIETLNEEIFKIKELDEAIFDLLEQEEDLEKDAEEVMDFDLKVKLIRENAKKYLWKHKEHAIDSSSFISRHVMGVKLPKFNLKLFEGDPRNWKPFIEAFEASIEIYIFKRIFERCGVENY